MDLCNVCLEVEVLVVEWVVVNWDDVFVVDFEKLLKCLEMIELFGDVQGYIKVNYEFYLWIYQQLNFLVLIDIINMLWLCVSLYLYQLEWENQYKVFNIYYWKIV